MLRASRGYILVLLALLPSGAHAADSLSYGGAGPGWEFSAAGFYYPVPAGEEYLMGVVTADRGGLHLEARYNYEDIRTGSAFAGWTVSTGTTLTVDLTPMAGVAFGSTSGLLPALEASLGYAMVDLYVEMEYFIDIGGTSSDFLFSWLELGASPAELVRFGVSTQRLRIRQTPLVLDRGLFLQLRPAFGEVSLYAFNLFTESWFLVIGLEMAW